MTILDAREEVEIKPLLSEALAFVAFFLFAFLAESCAIAIFLAWHRGELTLKFLVSLPVVISIGLTAWIIALLAFFASRIRASHIQRRHEKMENHFLAGRSLHVPSGPAFKNVLLALVAICGASNRVEEEKIQWIEMLYARWVEDVGVAQGRALDRNAIVRLVRSAAMPNGARTLFDLLKANGRNADFIDKQILLKCCFLLATIDGNASSHQCQVILKIVKAIDFPADRLLELAAGEGS